MEKDIPVNGNQKKVRMANLIPHKIDLKIKNVYILWDKEGHNILIRGSLQEGDITIVHIYSPNIGILQYIGQTLLLLLLSRFSPVWLCATPETASHKSPPSLGFSRQEHWSGLPFPSPMHESEKWKVKLLSHVRLLATPWTAAHQAPPTMGFSRQEYCSGVPLPSPGQTLTELKGKINSSTIIVWDFKHPTCTNGQIIKTEN